MSTCGTRHSLRSRSTSAIAARRRVNSASNDDPGGTVSAILVLVATTPNHNTYESALSQLHCSVDWTPSTSHLSGWWKTLSSAYVPVSGAMCDSLYAGVGASMRHTEALLVFGDDSMSARSRSSRATIWASPDSWLMSAGLRLPLVKRNRGSSALEVSLR